jgi:hypothetical protein
MARRPRCRYTRFLGNSSDLKQISDSAYFETNSADDKRVYAWINYPSSGCTTTLAYICEFPSSSFSCYPP